MEHTQTKEQTIILFEESFKQHFQTLCFHAMSFVNDLDTAKDIVHDVYLSTWNHRSTIDFSRPMLPYLLNLTHNRAINYLAHRKIRDNHIQCHLHDEPLYTPSEISDHEELITRIMQRIDQLPERCSLVMKLCFIECKKYKEIAEQLDISVNTVKTHVTTGLKILRDEFPATLLSLLILQCKFQSMRQ